MYTANEFKGIYRVFTGKSECVDFKITGIAGIHAIPMMITRMLQGTLCDTGIPCTFYGENI